MEAAAAAAAAETEAAFLDAFFVRLLASRVSDANGKQLNYLLFLQWIHRMHTLHVNQFH